MRSSKTDANANGLDVAVLVWTAGWRDAVADVEALCRAAVAGALAFGGGASAAGPLEVSIVLGDDAAIARLNRSFRHRDGPTNVLAFPTGDDPAPDTGGGVSPPPRLLGDVIVALETAAREAAEQDKSLADHLRHLLVHGMLHLLGYDHQSEGDAAVMEALEIAVLASLGVADPYGEVERGTPR